MIAFSNQGSSMFTHVIPIAAVSAASTASCVLMTPCGVAALESCALKHEVHSIHKLFLLYNLQHGWACVQPGRLL